MAEYRILDEENKWNSNEEQKSDGDDNNHDIQLAIS